MLALVAASAVVNGPLKWIFRRPRPGQEIIQLTRALRRMPITTSFPSGHAASAAAYATGVAVEWPQVALPIAIAAAGVAYSRVHVGVHYPGDVVAGVAIGIAAGAATAAWWPVAPDASTITPEATSTVDLTTSVVGFVVNAGAGTPLDMAAVAAVAPSVTVRVVEGDALPAAMRDEAARADVLGVWGGDGTVAAAATAVMAANKPLLVLPGGTLNHFARDVDATRKREATATAPVARVDVATAGNRVFLNTASVGLYSGIVRRRERMQKVIGKWPAAAVALVKSLRHETPLHVVIDGKEERVWCVFAGNGEYGTRGLDLARRHSLDDGTLDVRILSAEKPFSRTLAALFAAFGRIDACPGYRRMLRPQITLGLPAGARMTLDGEEMEAPSTLRLRVEPRALRVIVGS